MQQLEFFVEMSDLEQRVQLSGHLPSLESYQRRRMGTSAVGVCLAIHEYVPSPYGKLVLILTLNLQVRPGYALAAVHC